MNYKFIKILKYGFWRIKEFFALSVLKQNDTENRIVLVYTMGKVGSASIYETIKKNDIKIKVFHIHFLSDFWLFNKLKKIDYAKKNIIRGSKIRKYLKKNQHKRIKIITLVREPVSRAISDFFQNSKNKKFDLDQMGKNNIIETIKNQGFDFPDLWLQQEFLNFTGFNIFKNKFDKNKGFEIYNTEKFDILFIKLEKLSKIYKQALQEFLHLSVDEIIATNATEQKKEAELINKIKTHFALTQNELDKIYATDYVKKFYTKQEIENFAKKWTKKTDND